jgi:hypothetical protein
MPDKQLALGIALLMRNRVQKFEMLLQLNHKKVKAISIPELKAKK